jgi:hypothetical protein
VFRKAQTIALAGAIDHLTIVSYLDHPRQLKGTTQNVFGQTLQSHLVIRLYTHRVVDAESRMRPLAHGVNNFL